MSVSQAIETEENLLTCLLIKFYHPQQHCKGLYCSLPLSTRSTHQASDPLRFGRDAQACTYTLNDLRVSRKQLAIQAYRTPQSPDMLFSIQNLSDKARLLVNGSPLVFLERMDLPAKALLRFGEYEMEIVREPGEAKATFEVEFEVLAVSPYRETCRGVPSMTPVMDTGLCLMNPADDSARVPQEIDETLTSHSC